jgi:hypothetical protein
MNLGKCPVCDGKISLVVKEGGMYFHCKDNDCMRGSMRENQVSAYESWCREAYRYFKVVAPNTAV